MSERYVTDAPLDPRERYALYRLCDCPTCEGKGQVLKGIRTPSGMKVGNRARCDDCRGEGRIRQELAACESPEAVGLTLVTLGLEGEWEGCAFGLLDRMPECERCKGRGNAPSVTDRPPLMHGDHVVCPDCKGSGVKPTGTWIIRPWLPSARNLSDAGRTLAKARKK